MKRLNLTCILFTLGVISFLWVPKTTIGQQGQPYLINVSGRINPTDTVTLVLYSQDSCVDTLVYFQPQEYTFPCQGYIKSAILLGDYGLYSASVIEDTFKSVTPLEIFIFYDQDLIPRPPIVNQPPLIEFRPSIYIFGYPSLFESHRTLLKKDIFEIGDQSSIQTAINLVPGIKMDQRGPGGSARLSIRGSLLRSTFGMRGIKTYWEDLPLSNPNGTTPIELLDPWILGSLEIMKGPAGGSGIGTAGVFKANGWKWNRPEYASLVCMLNIEGGSWGYQRLGARFFTRKRNYSYLAEYVHQRVAGYRAQESNGKDQIHLSTNHALTSKLNLNAWLMAYRGFWELPGALDSLSMTQDPRQAVAASVTANAGINRDRLLGGTTLKYYISGPEKMLSLGMLGHITQKNNPYGTNPATSGYKLENGGNWAALLRYQSTNTYRPVSFLSRVWGSMLSTQAWLQAEWQSEVNHLRDHENIAGNPGQLRINDRSISQTGMLGAGYDLVFSNSWRISAKAHWQYLRYHIEDLFQTDSLDYSGNTTYPSQFLPAASVKFPLFKRMEMSLAFQTGYSPPANWEIAPPEGLRNNALQPEKARSFEAGYYLSLFKQKVSLNAQAYQQTTNGFILQQQDSSGFNYFDNVGKVIQRGLEARLSFNSDGQYRMQPRKFFYVGLAIHDFRKISESGPQTFQQGNRLVGIPFLTASMMGSVLIKDKISLSLNAHAYSRIPLDDSFTHFAKAYTLLGTKILYKLNFRRKFRSEFEPYIGGSNLLNMKYSSFLNLNGFNGKYYNPSPTRSVFAGINFNWF